MKRYFLGNYYFVPVFTLILLFSSCSETTSETEVVDIYERIEGSLGTSEFFKRSLSYDGYILMNDAQSNRVYVMDKNAEVVHEWDLTNNIGNDVFLLDDGKLLASLEADDPKMPFGGKGGKIQLVDKNNDIEWNFDYSSENYETHHDVEMLPNGNVIALVWERKTSVEAEQAGSVLDIDLFPEAIIEVDPRTDQIVWEWHAWDHLIQDHDTDKDNFGVISDHPNRIDLNYVTDKQGDIMHANGISYDEINDLIYISVNFFNEIWVIDHSTTSEQAASNTGGATNKGGDLVYRFGNPSAYQNSQGERLFFRNHYPNLLKETDNEHILVFSNGTESPQSTVYELKIPVTKSLEANADNEPAVLWSYTNEELFAPRVSGAVRLPNGNTLITEGDYGLWEVTMDGEVVWKFNGDGFFWRAYHYDKNSDPIRQITSN